MMTVSNVSVEYKCGRCDALINNPVGQEECPNGHKLPGNLDITLNVHDVVSLQESELRLKATIDRMVKEGGITEEEGNALKRMVKGLGEQARENIENPYKLAGHLEVLKQLIQIAYIISNN